MTRRRLLFTVAAAALTLLVIELGVLALFLVLEQRIFPRGELHREMHTLAGTTNETTPIVPAPKQAVASVQSRLDTEVLHPYLGYIPDLAREGREHSPFLGSPPGDLTHVDGRLVIAIFGGSFAEGTFNSAADRLATAVEQASSKQVKVVSFAHGGYKQPQQLIALTYLYSIGARFDFVINLDGFNEVALPPLDNMPKGVFPIYPRDWYFRARDRASPEELALLARLGDIDKRRTAWAGTFVRRRLYWSNTLTLLWSLRDRRLEREHGELLNTIKSSPAAERGYGITGPTAQLGDPRALYSFLAFNWKQSSLLMKNLCDANGATYLHFLQPNQYLENTKPMGSQERRIAIGDNPYGHSAIAGYPALLGFGKELRQQHVDFHDLTTIFADNDQLLYIDNCCHLNAKGYGLIADRIAESVIAGL